VNADGWIVSPGEPGQVRDVCVRSVTDRTGVVATALAVECGSSVKTDAFYDLAHLNDGDTGWSHYWLKDVRNSLGYDKWLSQ
jgi:hypothetical protein